MSWWQAAVRHVGATVFVGIVVLAGTGIGIVRTAPALTRQTATAVSAAIAGPVVERLATADYGATGGYHREHIMQTLETFLRSGSLSRVKLWIIRDGMARIVVSDLPQLEGFTRPADGLLAQLAHATGDQAWTVPDDGEHWFERGERTGLLEVFTTFSDIGGNLLTLEIYVAASVRATERDAARSQIPLMALAVLTVSAAASPFTIAATRRSRHLAAARNAVLSLAAAVGDRQRRDLARLLHDGPIQSLAAAHVALSAGVYPITTIGQMVQAGIAELRGLTGDLMPSHPPANDLANDLPRILRAEVPQAVALDIRMPAAPALTGPHLEFIVQAATELVRNAVRHGRPRQISITVTVSGGTVALVVSDDGSGFDPGRPAPDGHLGLALLHHAVASASGTLTVRSGPGAGCTATLRLPVPW